MSRTEIHNALAQVSLSLDGLTLKGFSISGVATYVQVPELDVCFDMGECPLSSLPLNHVLLTHAHGDHARCLPRHWQLRRMVGIVGDAVYFLPEEIRSGCEAWIRAEAQFEGVPEADVTTPPLIGLVPDGVLVPLPKRKDLRVRAFPVTHRVPSLGYTLFTHKRKLKAEYQGVAGDELARLRARGVDVQRDVDEPRLTFIGDCIGQSLLDEAHIWKSPVVIIEATFLAPGEEELAGRKGHTHIGEIARALEELGDAVETRHIVLKLFSMRYTASEIVEHVNRVIPARFRPRVRLLLGDDGSNEHGVAQVSS
jgi:ribonuclease Z